MILHAPDKNTNVLNQRIVIAFREAENTLLLKEINLTGRNYTWSNSRTHTHA